MYYKKVLDGLNVAFTKGTFIPASELTTIVTGLDANFEYVLYIRAVNIKGESIRSGTVYHYAGPVPSSVAAPTLIVSSRTDTTATVQWTTPGVSSTTVLGY